MSLSRVLRVAMTEYRNVIGSKAFLASVILMPIFAFGAVAVQRLVKDEVDLEDRTFAVIDGTGRLLEPLARAARSRNDHEVHGPDGAGEQVQPRFLPVDAAGASPAELSRRMEKGEIFAFVVIDEGVVRGEGNIAYHSASPTYQALRAWIGAILNEEIRRQRFEEAAIDRELVARLSRPVEVARYAGDAPGSAEGQGRRVSEIETFAVPAGAMFLLFFLVMMGAPALLHSVLEEKIQKIGEILVSSVSPFDLFLGKLVGLVLVSWTLAAVYVAGIAYVLHDYGLASVVPTSLYLLFPLFHLLALAIYGSMFLGLGAACSEIRDAQTMMLPATLLVILPMFVWMQVLQNPTSPFAIGASLFPPTTPFLLLLRIAVPPGPEIWEILVGIALTVGFSVACVWAASRIFRIGILAQGQTPSFRKVIGWIFSR